MDFRNLGHLSNRTGGYCLMLCQTRVLFLGSSGRSLLDVGHCSMDVYEFVSFCR